MRLRAPRLCAGSHAEGAESGSSSPLEQKAEVGPEIRPRKGVRGRDGGGGGAWALVGQAVSCEGMNIRVAGCDRGHVPVSADVCMRSCESVHGCV